jgi:hypothetical protein
MVDIKDLNILDSDNVEQIIEKILIVLGITSDKMKESISSVILNKADDIVLELKNIAPLGDYSKLLEDNESMINFLKTEVYKTEYWNLVRMDTDSTGLNKFTFNCTAIDDGQSLYAFVFVNDQGKIRHTFVQGND